MAHEKDSQDNQKAERLAAALRANLARRKAQARGRRAAGPDGADAPQTPASAGTAKPPLREPAIVPDDEPG